MAWARPRAGSEPDPGAVGEGLYRGASGVCPGGGCGGSREAGTREGNAERAD